MIAMFERPQPIVSFAQGPPVIGGMGIALASDIRLPTPEARFNAAFIKIGASGCDMGSSHFLPCALRLTGQGPFTSAGQRETRSKVGTAPGAAIKRLTATRPQPPSALNSATRLSSSANRTWPRSAP